MGRTVLMLGAAALALAACSKTADKQAANGAAPAGEAAKTTAAEAPSGPPTRKAGLWEQTMAFNGMKQTMRMCVDEATEQKAKWWSTERRRGAGGSPECSEQKFSRSLTGGWTIHAVCHEPGGMTVATDGTATGDFGNNYHVEMTSVTTGSSMAEANGTHKMVMDGAWKGPCPAGWTPGDMELPGGMRMNVLNPGAGPSGGMGPGGRPSRAQIEQLRAQAEEMRKQMKQGAQ